jgi:hypothetical protein
MDVGVALGKWWMPGDRALVRGYLAVISVGPPCDPKVSPGGGRCGGLWTLWESASHPVEFEFGPGNALTLAAQSSAADGSSPLPELPEPLDAGRTPAQPAFRDLDVTISGSIPEHLCAPETDSLFEVPIGERCTGRMTSAGVCEVCAQRWLRQLALNVETVCRNLPG